MKARARQAALLGIALFIICLSAFALSGVPLLQRGPWAAVCFLSCLASFFVGVGLGPPVKEDEKLSGRIDSSTTITLTDPPTDKARMREAVMGGVLEAIKGLVVRSENNEREIKELKTRVSELSLAAGLKPRVSRPGQEKKP